MTARERPRRLPALKKVETDRALGLAREGAARGAVARGVTFHCQGVRHDPVGEEPIERLSCQRLWCDAAKQAFLFIEHLENLVVFWGDFAVLQRDEPLECRHVDAHFRSSHSHLLPPELPVPLRQLGL